jgi:hypothetical protein
MTWKDWAKLAAAFALMIGCGVVVLLGLAAVLDESAKAPALAECKAQTAAAEKRALAAEVNELKARLAVASAEKSRTNLEAALKEARAK